MLKYIFQLFHSWLYVLCRAYCIHVHILGVMLEYSYEQEADETVNENSRRKKISFWSFELKHLP
jgi:hypothetical protein